jgi:dihydrofolate reductase
MSATASTSTTKRAIEITGYAIVSDDDRIAGADGLVPLSLHNEADWYYYQNALANSDLIVFGHRSHKFEPNERGDRRLVVWSAPTGLLERDDACWWNPSVMSWSDVARRLLPEGGQVAVPGGQGVFDLFLKIGYDAFHLSRAHGVRLPGGRAIFSACDRGVPAETVLARAGLRVDEKIPLDPERGVDTTVWRRT